MFHKITPSVPSITRFMRGPYGYAEFFPPSNIPIVSQGQGGLVQAAVLHLVGLPGTSGPAGNKVIPLVVDGVAGMNMAFFRAPNIAGQSSGLLIQAGTNSSDTCVNFDSASGNQYLRIVGDGGSLFGNPTGGTQGSGTLNAATGYYVNGVPLALTGVLLSTLGSNETRAVVTSSDSALSVSIPAAGTYVIDFDSQMFQSGATAAGANIGFHFTGTTNGHDTVQTLGKDQNDVVHTQGGGIGGVTNIDMSITQFHTFATGAWMSGILYATSSGTLSITWGQNTASGTTSIQAGAALRAYRIA